MFSPTNLRHALSNAAFPIALTLFAQALFLQGCIGTDFLDETVELFEPRITVTPVDQAIEVNQTLAYEAEYFDSTATKQDVDITWSSSDASIVSIASDGSAMGLMPGQVEITAQAFGTTSGVARLTVVNDPNEVALVRIAPMDTSIDRSSTVQYTARPENVSGELVEGLTISWITSDTTLAIISETGLLTARQSGSLTVMATAGDVDSAPAQLSIMALSRTGTFEKTPGTSYRLSGTGTLARGENGLEVRFADDFSVSNGPDLHVYLSTSSRINATSVDLGDLKATTGAQTYPVPSNIQITDFDFIVIHCLPFNVTFGFAPLN